MFTIATCFQIPHGYGLGVKHFSLGFRWWSHRCCYVGFPDGRRIIHHALAFLVQEELGITRLASTATDAGIGGLGGGGGLFMEWAVGKRGELFPEDAGKLMLPGAQIMWELHMHAIGEEIVDNVAELGVWFYPEGYVPQNRTMLNAWMARASRTLTFRRAKSPSHRISTCCKRRLASRTSSRTCTCAARR